jgi:hypothetical protein
MKGYTPTQVTAHYVKVHLEGSWLLSDTYPKPVFCWLQSRCRKPEKTNQNIQKDNDEEAELIHHQYTA